VKNGATYLHLEAKSFQPRAKADLHEIWMAETRASVNKAFDAFLGKYRAKYEDACACF
jgi:hypothetical protein